jgi:hypothetical protein
MEHGTAVHKQLILCIDPVAVHQKYVIAEDDESCRALTKIAVSNNQLKV